MGAACLGNTNGAIGGFNHGATVTHHNKLGTFCLLANGFG
jgi:hypothetical protein